MLGWSHEALVHELLVVPRRAFTPWAGTDVIEGPGWLQLVTPSFRLGGLNEVIFAALDEHEAEARIDATIAGYAELGLRFRWTITPGCRPDDLEQRLARRGLQRIELIGMVAATADVTGSDSNIIEVERVDGRTIATYVEIMAAGWKIDVEPLAAYARAQLDDPEQRCWLYLARHRGQPAAAAGCVRFDASLHLQGGVVLPGFRQRGLYRALTSARLRDAASCGIEIATTHAMRETSAPLLERFGFRELVRFVTMSG